ncbi:MAG: sugar phosphate isomerase/epimerase [Lachnospiraceae bacterium]|nr:sugar phosphate isomerase/epimerase [Lachnospiraceae bacterium]MDE7200885.1 sugar phosphate isomerase/epimerase [Lachnospiraceae bacterium]
MIEIGVQTKNVVNDDYPEEGFAMLRRAGFTYADFNLNGYLLNESLYRFELNDFYGQSISELERFFAPHKQGAMAAGIVINQMHMPYPSYIPNATAEINNYLMHTVAPKSMEVCAFFGCPYIVVHGFKLARNLGSEAAEWEQTETFLESLAPMAKELKITICMENIYTNIGNHIIEGPCCDVRKAVARIDQINEKYGAEVLGFCFDTGHANLIGIDFEDFITTLGSRLKVLHIHDNDGIGDLHQIPFTFTRSRENASSTDWDGFIRGLRKIQFDGVLSFETAPVLSAFPKIMKQDVLSFIAQIGNYFAGEIQENILIQ